MIITTTTMLSWNLKGRSILSSTMALLSVDNPHAPAFTCYFFCDCRQSPRACFLLAFWREEAVEEMEFEEEEREERWCRPERLEGYLERGVCGCAWVRQWQQLFGLYTTARIRYRPLSPGVDLDEAKSSQLPDECLPTGDITTLLRAKEEVKFEELVGMSQGLLQCLGVSHVSIAAVCQITAAFKLQSKLTGAGGGGFVLTLLPKQMASMLVEVLKVDMDGQGFSCLEAAIGRHGVQGM